MKGLASRNYKYSFIPIPRAMAFSLINREFMKLKERLQQTRDEHFVNLCSIQGRPDLF